MFKHTPFTASFLEIGILYLLEVITLIYLFRKYRKSLFHIYIILLCYPLIFDALGKEMTDIYRILTLIFTVWISINRKIFSSFKKGDNLITFFFILFSLSFIYFSSENGDTWTIIYSQYSRYFIAYCMWFLVREDLYFNYRRKIPSLMSLVYDIIIIQIVVSIGKLFIFSGRQMEGLVGTVFYIGGGAGTIIPIIGFIILWFNNKGVFSRKDWFNVIGLMLLGFLAAKRAIWFIMPVVILAFMFYIPRLKINSTVLIAVFLLPIVFYFGVRLTPTLNPDKKIWGSFDAAFVFDYANKYQFGDESKSNNGGVQGRGGATLLLWGKLKSDIPFTKQDFFGQGLTNMYTTTYEEFNKLNNEIEMKGDATGVYQSYYTTGFIGVFLTILLFFSMLWSIKIKRLRWVMIGIVAWDYLMYAGLFFRFPTFMFMIIFIIHYSNYLNRKLITNEI